MNGLSHVSESSGPIQIHATEQSAKPAMKPTGLWYEVDADWRRWCSSEMPHWVEGRFLHQLAIGEERMLRLTTVAALDRFVAEYGVTEDVEGLERPLHLGIRWAAVAESWDGIEIAPYQWSRRLNGPLWYYGWDCASGCIWRPQGATLDLIGPAPLAVPA